MRGTTAIVQCNEEVTTRLAPSPSPSSSSLDSASKSGDDGSSHKKDAAAWLAQVISDNPYEPGSDKSIVGNPTTADDRARIKKAVGKHGAASIKKAVDTAFAQTSAAAKGQGASSGGGGGGKKKKSKARFLNVTNIYRKAGGRCVAVSCTLCSLVMSARHGKQVGDLTVRMRASLCLSAALPSRGWFVRATTYSWRAGCHSLRRHQQSPSFIVSPVCQLPGRTTSRKSRCWIVSSTCPLIVLRDLLAT